MLSKFSFEHTSERYIRVTLRDAKRHKTCGKYQNITEFLPSAQSPYRNENLTRNRYWTLPAVRYFTWKLEFVSNNLWVNAEYTLKLIKTISSAQKTFSFLQMVTADLLPLYHLGLCYCIWSSIQKNKISSLVVNVDKLIRIFSDTAFSSVNIIRLYFHICLHDIEKMVKHTLETVQCLHHNIFKSIFNHFFNVFYNRSVMKI